MSPLGRRSFLVGLGRFAGAVLVLPVAPAIFDMGRGIETPPSAMDGSGFAINQRIHESWITDSDADFWADEEAFLGRLRATPWYQTRLYEAVERQMRGPSMGDLAQAVYTGDRWLPISPELPAHLAHATMARDGGLLQRVPLPWDVPHEYAPFPLEDYRRG